MYTHTYGRTRTNESFSPDIVEAVWKKGVIIPGVDQNKRRKDSCGALIDRNQYGVTKDNGTGWEIDHVNPVSKGGKDELSNYQPLQWQNNRTKGDTVGQWSCAITAKA